jgi:hypothetical protein
MGQGVQLGERGVVEGGVAPQIPVGALLQGGKPASVEIPDRVPDRLGGTAELSGNGRRWSYPGSVES